MKIYMNNIAIRVEHLSKYYRLGVINNGTLFRDIQTWWALKLGKEDPHSIIGSTKYDISAKGFWALKDLNFEIKQGDRVGIIGKNGAGKSTLLKVLSRITAPTDGTAKINGRIASLLEVGTGFHGELSGRENIYLNGAILGMKHYEVTKKLDEIIAFSEIEQYIDTPVKRYSSGMYVRLAFAVAAHLDNEILIADEVLAVGDASFQKKALGKMNELSVGQGRTVLFVSHQMHAISSICNKGIVLDKGKLFCQSDLNEAIAFYDSLINSNKELDTTNRGKLCSCISYDIDKGKIFQVTKVSVLGSYKRCQDAYESFEDLYIEISVIKNKTLNGLYSYFALEHNDTKRNIIICDSNEIGNNVFDRLPIGSSTLQMKIPAHTLGCGLYNVVINFTGSDGQDDERILSPKYSCCFEVVDTISERGSRRNSITGLVLPWEII